jgi:hypothetical protein
MCICTGASVNVYLHVFTDVDEKNRNSDITGGLLWQRHAYVRKIHI